MRCPECENKTNVFDSREYAGATYRKRVCVACGFSFYTEEYEIENKQIIKDMRRFVNDKYRKQENI